MAEQTTGREGAATPCVQARSLEKTFSSETGGITILSGMDFAMEHGESVAVVGASGIGKSTLLHILGTLDKPDAGQLLLMGQDVFSLSDSQIAAFRNRNVGFVFQFHHLLPEFTALGNAAIPAMIGGLDKKSAREKAEAVLVRVGLADRLHHRIGELSGGEQQRVAVARALVRGPALFLADEPTGNLDVKTGAKIHELLVELNAETQMTMIVVTHNMDLANMMKRVVTVEEGTIKQLNHRL